MDILSRMDCTFYTKTLRTCALKLHFNADLHSLSFSPHHSALIMSSCCPYHHAAATTIKPSAHKQPTPSHNLNIILIIHISSKQDGLRALPFVTQASDSSAEEPIPKDPPPPCSIHNEAAASTTAPCPPPLPKVPKKPLVQSGLFGFKFMDTTKRIHVRQAIQEKVW